MFMCCTFPWFDENTNFTHTTHPPISWNSKDKVPFSQDQWQSTRNRSMIYGDSQFQAYHFLATIYFVCTNDSMQNELAIIFATKAVPLCWNRGCNLMFQKVWLVSFKHADWIIHEQLRFRLFMFDAMMDVDLPSGFTCNYVSIQSTHVLL